MISSICKIINLYIDIGPIYLETLKCKTSSINNELSSPYSRFRRTNPGLSFGGCSWNSSQLCSIRNNNGIWDIACYPNLYIVQFEGLLRYIIGDLTSGNMFNLRDEIESRRYSMKHANKNQMEFHKYVYNTFENVVDRIQNTPTQLQIFI